MSDYINPKPLSSYEMNTKHRLQMCHREMVKEGNLTVAAKIEEALKLLCPEEKSTTQAQDSNIPGSV